MPHRLSHKILWFMLALCMAFYCYEFFLRISPSVVVGELMQYFQLDAFGISKLLAWFYIAYTLGQIPAGLLLDRYPLRIVLAIATCLCALGVALFISSHSIITATIGRFIIGFASSFAFIAVLKIARVYLPSKYFARIVGINVALGTLLAAYGDVLASYLKTQHFKDIFYINIFIGLLISALFAFFYRHFAEHPSERENRIHHFSWFDLKVLLKNPALWLNGLVGGLFYLPTTVLADVWGDYFLQNQDHLSLTQSSYVITWLFLGWMVGSPIMGYLADRFQCRRAIIGVNALIATFLLLQVIFLPKASVLLLSGLMFLFGLSSSAQLIIWRIFHQLAPLNLAATGIAFTNMIVMLTCALGQVTIGFFMSCQQNSDNIALYTSQDYQHSLMFLPIALIAAAFLVRLLPKSHR